MNSKYFANLNLKTRAMLVTASGLILLLTANILFIVSSGTNSARDALIARASALVEGMKKEMIATDLPLHELEGMGMRMRGLVEEEKYLSGLMLMDGEGKVFFSSKQLEEGVTLHDQASRDALAASSVEIKYYADSAGGRYEKIIPLVSADNRKVGVLRLGVKEEAITQESAKLLRQALLLNSVSFLLIMALVYYFTYRRFKPIEDMVASAGRIAAGDLSAVVAVKGRTELDKIGNAINTLSSSLKEMLRKIRATSAGLGEAMNLVGGAARKMSHGAQAQQEATDQTATVVNEMVASIKSVALNAEEMSNAAANASSSAYQMATSNEEVARNTGALAASVEETASSIGEMIASIKQVSENTDAVAASAEQTSSSITQMSASVKEVEQRALESARLAERVSEEAAVRGMAAAAEAIKGMENIKQTVEATAAVVNRLGNRSQEIGQILKVIDEVTDQTGLLALNAAILAAQAGERGKGFAVVAEEIKDLAERTAFSTQEIAGLIASVREETAQSVQAMGRGLKAVETGVSLVNVTSEVLRQVADSSRLSADMARAIERTTAEQAKGVAQITETSINIAGQIEQIARALQEQRNGSERIAQAAEQMRENTRQVKTATQDQTSGSRQIADAVESVTVQAARVASATAEQNVGMQQIIEAISRIQQITQDTMDVSVQMDMAVEGIKEKAATLQAELDGFKF